MVLPLLVPLPREESSSDESNISSISSISDSSLDEEIAIRQLVRIPRPRIQNYMVVVDQYSDGEFKSHFRYALYLL